MEIIHLYFYIFAPNCACVRCVSQPKGECTGLLYLLISDLPYIAIMFISVAFVVVFDCQIILLQH